MSEEIGGLKGSLKKGVANMGEIKIQGGTAHDSLAEMLCRITDISAVVKGFRRELAQLPESTNGVKVLTSLGGVANLATETHKEVSHELDNNNPKSEALSTTLESLVENSLTAHEETEGTLRGALGGDLTRMLSEASDLLDRAAEGLARTVRLSHTISEEATLSEQQMTNLQHET